MKQPEKYFCDMCGKEIIDSAGVINRDIPVVTDQDWNTGGLPHFTSVPARWICVMIATLTLLISSVNSVGQILRGGTHLTMRRR